MRKKLKSESPLEYESMSYWYFRLLEQLVVSEIGATQYDGEHYMFMHVPGMTEVLVGPYTTKEAVMDAINDFNKMCESVGGMTVPGGLAN